MFIGDQGSRIPGSNAVQQQIENDGQVQIADMGDILQQSLIGKRILTVPLLKELRL